MKNATKLILMLMIFTFSTSIMFGQVDTRPVKEKTGTEYLPKGEAPAYMPSDDKAVLLDESFEGSWLPSGWSKSQIGTYGFRKSTSGYGHTGSYCAWHNDDMGSQDSWLISPVMNFSTIMAYQLSFWETGGWLSYYTFHEVAVTTNGGGSWTQLYSAVPTSSYAQIVLDLTPFAGASSVQVGFHYIGNWSDDWYIDDVIVESLEIGDVYGYVFNGMGITIAGATVGIDALGMYTTSYPDGHYRINDVVAGNQDVFASMAGYNTITHTVNIPIGGEIQQDFILTAPTMIISPTFHTYTLNPEEYFITQTGILNTGDGPLTWSAQVIYPVTDLGTTYPKYGESNPAMLEYGSVSDPNAFNRTGAHDKILDEGTDAVGDVILSWPAPSSIALAWGIGFDGTNLWLTDPYNPSTIQECTPAGALTGNTIPSSFGGSWVGDMTSDGVYLYACNVGGDNGIKIIELSTGNLIATITGAYSYTSQRGLGYDAINDEFYIGGWNSDMIWRVDNGGATISSTAFNGVSGLEWHPQGGPDGLGSLWVVENTSVNIVTEVDPNNSWVVLQTFVLPGGGDYVGAGIALHEDGNLWMPNQDFNTVYLVDSEEPLSGGGSWLTLDYYNNIVAPLGGLDNVPTNFDAQGTVAGEVYTADLVFTSSDPYVGTITIPCTMIIAGDPLVPPTDLTVELIDDIVGTVELNWLWTTDLTFQFFIVRRDGVPVGTSPITTYTEDLPDYGTYCYTVQSFYDEGTSVPSDEVCVDWDNPTIFISPDDLHGWVWIGETVDVYTTVYNNGIGTLEFTFPEFVTTDLLNDPSIEQNKIGSPIDNADIIDEKTTKDPYAGTGYDVVLGAGGPDDFGYTWIDSDEAGGPAYNWIDISTTGTRVMGLSDDNIVGPYDIGFTFKFYGEEKTQFWVNSNGTIGFTSNYITLSNYSIPTGNSYVDFIAWFWDDMDPTSNTYVWYETIGNMLVITFDHYYEYPDSQLDYVDAQIQMTPMGKITILYDYLHPSLHLTGSTYGVQSSDNSVGLQVAHNTSYLHNGLAVQISPPIDFIVDVVPAHGYVSQGGAQDIVITYDSDGYDAGDYEQELECTSNDPANPSVIIDNTMHVYVPGHYAGSVTDCESGLAISGVTVTASIWQTVTDVYGDYSLYVDEGAYDVYFDKLGYESYVELDTFALAGVVTPLDVVLCEDPYAVPWVLATVIYPAEDTCDVEWSLPEGPYEIIYDDGEAEDLFAWSSAGNENAVLFTPLGYPANIIGGRVYVGDGSFPAGSWIGTEFVIMVYDDDGTGGLPGAMLDSIGVTVNNFGWVEFYGLDVTLDDGEFYLSMLQVNPSPNTAPIGIDLTMPPVFRSYSRTTMTEWGLSVYQDFMIRAFVEGPLTDVITDSEDMVYPSKASMAETSEYFTTANNSPFITRPGTVKAGTTGNIEGYVDNSEAVLYYVVARMSDFDPNLGPATGTMTILNNVTGMTYQDAAFGALPMGWYAYAVQVAYSSGLVSPWTYSNIVGRDKDAEITFEITLCDGNIPEDVEITMLGQDFPYTTYNGVTDATGIHTFAQVWKGEYEIELIKIGYEGYHWMTIISADDTIEVLMSEKKYAPRNLWVDPLTSYAYWDPPLISALNEDFEGITFPPSGWLATSNSIGWFRTDDGSSTYWTIPSWSSYYACSNDDDAGPSGDGSVDYLITPPLDLREVDTYRMTFDSFYDQAWGLQIATVEYSYDAGATWDVFYALPISSQWESIDLDLASFSGLTATNPVWFAFHADDGGGWASGWAIDNVDIANGEIDPVAYHVYLDGSLDGITDTTFYQYEYLTFGVTYTASVAAQYSCGLSDEIYYTFTSMFLLPPRNLDGQTFDHTVHTWWEPPIEPVTDGISVDLHVPAFTGVIETDGQATSSKAAPVTSAGGEIFDPVYLDGFLADNFGWIGAPSDDNLYKMDMETYGSTLVGSSVTDPASGDFENNNFDMMYAAGNWGANLYEVDVLTGAGTLVAPFSGVWDNVSGMATDRTTGIMYVCGTNISAAYIGILDPTTGVIVQIGPNITNAPGLIDIAIDGTGQMYGWCIVNDNSYAIDKATGIATLLGSLGYNANYGQGGNWDPNDDVIYLTAYNATAGSSQLRALDRVTGATVYLSGLPATQCAAFGVPYQSSGGGGNVPENFIGYNLYRDFDNIAYIPYTEEDTTHYFDYELEPLCYEYDVTAIYDLTPYGFPGETGESMYEGPYDVCVQYGWPLAFIEDWTTGSFDPNLWSHGDNWVVNGQFGNPMPCAEFKWNPVLVDYKSALTSYPIDGMYHPGTTDPYIDGRIFFDFDISLVDNGMSGDEIINVDVWDEGNWFNVATFSNADGNFPWTSYHFEITDHAFGKIFKVRFSAEGVNSTGILSWFVDNIHLYRQCDAPRDLTAVGVDIKTIDLNWTSPATGGGPGPTGEWIMWDDGVYASAVGLTGGGVFSVASHWDADMITAYAGMYITKIRFAPGATSLTTTFTLKIWEGADAGTLLYEEGVSGLILGDWNEITLATPVAIDVTKELWFGYTVDSPADSWPAGADAGPAVATYGDMISLDGTSWDALSLISTIDRNWSLQAYVASSDGASVPMIPIVDNTVYSTPDADPVAIEAANKVSVENMVSTRAFTGYNIYWNDDAAGYNFLEFTEDTFYTHTVADPFIIGSVQCYYVTAVFEDCEPESNEACVIATGIEDPAIADGISVYPNPARDILNITSSTDITHVTIMNYLGQVVYNQKVVEDNDLQLSVAGYETGVYMVKVETTAGVLIKKVTIAH